MKEINCFSCGGLVAKLATGSLIKKDTVCYCSKCDDSKVEDVDYKNDDIFGDTLQSLKDLFGMK